MTDKPLPGIEHVVVLMLENRSFDNVLGFLSPQTSTFDGLKGTESNPLDPRSPNGQTYSVWSLPAAPTDASVMSVPYPDPGELFEDMGHQIFGTEPRIPGRGAMNGFVWNYVAQPPSPDGVTPVADDIMQTFRPANLPITSALARGYAVCDRWFASGPVQTLPNRTFLHCGSATLLPGTNTPRLNNTDYPIGGTWMPPSFDPPVKDRTIFQLLDEKYPKDTQLNWKVYYHDAPLAAICKHVYENWYYDTWDSGNVFQFQERFVAQTNFELDIVNGRLPRYSVIEPRYSNVDWNLSSNPIPNSNHPGGAGIDWSDPNGASLPPPISACYGERLLHQVHSILAKYPETFAKTLLVIVYDEHGGLYDHVPPPAAVPPFSGQPPGMFRYDMYGVRVPAILVNPKIVPFSSNLAAYRPAAGSKYPFDHASIIATLRAQFDLGAALTPRDEAAPLLVNLVDPGRKAQVATLPPAPACREPKATLASSDEAGATPCAQAGPRRPSHLNSLIALLVKEAHLRNGPGQPKRPEGSPQR